jgi:predicted transcriptional regulator
MSAPVTIDLDEETLIALDGFAANMEQSRSVVIDLALREWLSAQADFATHVQAGIADAEADRFVSQDEIERIAHKYDRA